MKFSLKNTLRATFQMAAFAAGVLTAENAPFAAQSAGVLFDQTVQAGQVAAFALTPKGK